MGLKRKSTPSSLDALRAPQKPVEPPKDDSSIVELIGRRRRQITVHSELYYRMNENIIDDHTFDQWSEELVELQKNYPHASQMAPFYREFRDFDGSTGFHLTGQPWAAAKAIQLLSYHRERIS